MVLQKVFPSLQEKNGNHDVFQWKDSKGKVGQMDVALVVVLISTVNATSASEAVATDQASRLGDTEDEAQQGT